MSREGAIALADRIKSDEEFRNSLANAPDKASQKQIVSDAGFDVGPEDNEAFEEALGGEGELSDSELEGVSGGGVRLFFSMVCAS